MKNIIKDLQALRQMIIDDCAISEETMELEQTQWLARIDNIKMKAETLFNNVDLADVIVCRCKEPI